jgi:DNA-binding NtrC family response regulator
MSQARHNDQLITQENFGFRGAYIGDRFRSVERKFREKALNFFVDCFCLKNDVDLKEFLENLERNIIVNALSRFNGNQKNTARYLGLKHTTLHQKVKKYNIHFRKQPTSEFTWSETAD